MVGEFNRQNPYVVQIIESMEPLKHKTLGTSVVFTKYLIYGILVATAGCVATFSVNHIHFFVLILLCGIMVSSISFKRVMSLNPIGEITRIIYGNQYEKIYVNNEVLLNIIEDIAFFKGMLELLELICKLIFYSICISSIGICIVRWGMWIIK